jgi:hypothetical protein
LRQIMSEYFIKPYFVFVKRIFIVTIVIHPKVEKYGYPGGEGATRKHNVVLFCRLFWALKYNKSD